MQKNSTNGSYCSFYFNLYAGALCFCFIALLAFCTTLALIGAFPKVIRIIRLKLSAAIGTLPTGGRPSTLAALVARYSV